MIALQAYKEALVRECLVMQEIDPDTASEDQRVGAQRAAYLLCKHALEANMIAGRAKSVVVDLVFETPREASYDTTFASLSSKSTVVSRLADSMRDDFMSHVKPEVRARRESGASITWAEMQTMRCNSYEWQHLTPLFDDDALMRHTLHALNNCDHGGCPSGEYTRPCASYPEQLERLLVPMLMQRLAAAKGLTVPEVQIDTDAGFKPEEDDAP